jgi:hypothetical protein
MRGLPPCRSSSTPGAFAAREVESAVPSACTWRGTCERGTHPVRAAKKFLQTGIFSTAWGTLSPRDEAFR